MTRKGLFVLSLVLMFSMLLAACGGGGAAQETPAVTEPAVTEPTEMVEEPTEAVTEPVTEEPTEAVTEAVTEEATEPAATGEIDCLDAQEGDEISMLYQWSGTEEENLNAILQPFLDACGVTIAPESSRDQALLDTRVQAGNPPDVAFWNIAQLEQYQDQLIPIDDLPVNADNYAEFWRDLGSINGTWFGLPVKADVKSIIWYSPAAFEAFGYEVPETWDELEALADQMVADGNVPWSLGFESGDATGWTG
ncbi:MAG TPA: extracellular solute-binding protein, partial [Anaerolineaceae bacterium]|nr:extracellular solute-binding protein [Anaerolineaceae bacterium]